jgi:hypothetical protein
MERESCSQIHDAEQDSRFSRHLAAWLPGDFFLRRQLDVLMAKFMPVCDLRGTNFAIRGALG